MKLQLAIDIPDKKIIFNIIDEIYEIIDIIEIGTPVIMKYGVEIVKSIKSKYKAKKILADLKIIDGGKKESEIGFDSNADIITVLSHSSEKTLIDVKEVANNYGKEVMLDFINSVSSREVYSSFFKYDFSYYCIHTSHDSTITGENPLNDLTEFYNICNSNKIAVAGGITPQILKKILKYKPGIIVIGSYITNSNYRKNALEIQNIIKNESNQESNIRN